MAHTATLWCLALHPNPGPCCEGPIVSLISTPYPSNSPPIMFRLPPTPLCNNWKLWELVSDPLHLSLLCRSSLRHRTWLPFSNTSKWIQMCFNNTGSWGREQSSSGHTVCFLLFPQTIHPHSTSLQIRGSNILSDSKKSDGFVYSHASPTKLKLLHFNLRILKL